MKGLFANKCKLGSSQTLRKPERTIQNKLIKEAFFQDILKHVYKEFSKEHQELLFQQLEIHNQNTKKRKRVEKENSNVVTPEGQQIPSFNQTQAFPFRKFDTSIFTFNQKTPFPNRLIPQKKFSPRKFLSTPKQNKRQPSLPLEKKLFQVDSKMRKNYQRVKQRLGLKSREESSRIFNSIRSSLTAQRESQTQRAVRFRTEFQEGERWVPRMLMGDLQGSTKQRKLDMRAEDRRMQCFLARYKFDQ